MEDRDQNIANILKHIKGLRKDIREKCKKGEKWCPLLCSD